MAGASMFAILAAAGSLGCSLGPWVGGVVTDFTMKLLSPGTGLNAGQVGPMSSGQFGLMSVEQAGLLNAGQFGLMSAEQIGLRAGLLAGAIFPLASFVSQLLLKRKTGGDGAKLSGEDGAKRSAGEGAKRSAGGGAKLSGGDGA